MRRGDSPEWSTGTLATPRFTDKCPLIPWHPLVHAWAPPATAREKCPGRQFPRGASDSRGRELASWPGIGGAGGVEVGLGPVGVVHAYPGGRKCTGAVASPVLTRSDRAAVESSGSSSPIAPCASAARDAVRLGTGRVSGRARSASGAITVGRRRVHESVGRPARVDPDSAPRFGVEQPDVVGEHREEPAQLARLAAALNHRVLVRDGHAAYFAGELGRGAVIGEPAAARP